MYDILFYTDAHGNSELQTLIKELDSSTNKRDKALLKQIIFYIELLQKSGTRAGEPYVKHIEKELWELRPGGRRILFFAWKNNKIVLLHQFRKVTRKTPPREIDKAKREITDWKARN